MLKNLFGPKNDAPEEHHIVLPGIEVSFNETTHTVFLVDQTGGDSGPALKDLEDYLRSQGWFLHSMLYVPPPPLPAPRDRSA